MFGHPASGLELLDGDVDSGPNSLHPPATVQIVGPIVNDRSDPELTAPGLGWETKQNHPQQQRDK